MVIRAGISAWAALGGRASAPGGSCGPVASLGRCPDVGVAQRSPPGPYARPGWPRIITEQFCEKYIFGLKSLLVMIFRDSPFAGGPAPGSPPWPPPADWEAGAGRRWPRKARQRPVESVCGRATPNIDKLPSPVMPRVRRSRPDSMRGSLVAPSPGSRGGSPQIDDQSF